MPIPHWKLTLLFGLLACSRGSDNTRHDGAADTRPTGLDGAGGQTADVAGLDAGMIDTPIFCGRPFWTTEVDLGSVPVNTSVPVRIEFARFASSCVLDVVYSVGPYLTLDAAKSTCPLDGKLQGTCEFALIFTSPTPGNKQTSVTFSWGLTTITWVRANVVAGEGDAAVGDGGAARDVGPGVPTSGDGGEVGVSTEPACRTDKIAFSQDTGCQNDGAVEFCIPGNDAVTASQVKGIAPTVTCSQGAGGRAGCKPGTEQLCQLPIPHEQCPITGSMPDALWRTVCRLAALDAVTRIVPTWYE